MANTRDINIRVELYERAVPARHELKQGDTTRLIVDVRRSGEPYDLAGLGLLLNIKRHDELVYLQTTGYELAGNVATLTLEPPIVAEPGDIELELVLTNADGEVLSSFVFRLTVAARLLAGDEDIAPEVQQQIIDAANAAALSVTQAREARDAAETAAFDAKASEEAAAKSAAASAQSEKNAADSEASAKQNAETSEAAAKAAAESETAAKKSASAAETAQKAAESAKNETVVLAEGAAKDADRAETAASGAQSSASTAASAAGTASSSATSAAASAKNAAVSEANAANSETSAEAAAKRAEGAIENVGFAEMEIGEDGCLYLIRTENIVDYVNFAINSDGELEATIS